MIRPTCNCGAKAELRKLRIASGYHVCWYCAECEQKVRGDGPPWLPQDGMILDDIEELHEPSVEMCYHCRQILPCEWHHYAPQAMFDDADKWPQGWLCRPCHEIWHATMGQPIGRIAS